ncbi:MAG: hypothetical protein ACP5GI_00530 [Sulfolobales archaeon]
MSKRDERDKSLDVPRRDPRRDFSDRGRPHREVAERVHIREGEIEPKPIGIYCNPLCPYFRCAKRALTYKTIGAGAGTKIIAFCNWVGDQCIAGACQYAFCEKRYLLPGNRCLYAIEREKKKTSGDMFRELDQEEREARRLRDHLKKHYGKDLDLY